MNFSEAIKYVTDYGVAMLTAEGSNINAVAVSSKDGLPINEAKDFCVAAYVDRKLGKDELKKQNVKAFDQVFAQAVGEPKKSVEIDIVESGGPYRPQTLLSVPYAQRGAYGGPPPMLDSQKMFQSLRCGIGITNPVNDIYPKNLSVGTLGFFVRDDSGNTYLVSNNHVIGDSSDKASVGKVIGQSVVQPGTLDLTLGELRTMPTLATLEAVMKIGEVAAIVPLKFQTPKKVPVNNVDAAMARLTASTRTLNDLDRLTYAGGIRGIGSYQTDVNDPNRILGDPRVFKVGRTTGYTEGTIVGIGGAASISYGPGKIAYFAGQLIIKNTPDSVGPFSGPGDSGSGILNARNELVGLLYAGSVLQTLANPIAEVLSELAAALSGKSGSPPLTVVTL